MTVMPPHGQSGISAFEQYLGKHGMAEVLAGAGITGRGGELLDGLPTSPGPGRPAFSDRIRSALTNFCTRFPAGQVIVSAEVPAIDALDAVRDLPAAIWLNPGSSTQVRRHFENWTSGALNGGAPIEVQVAPQLPTPKGPCPVLVLLGSVVGQTCYLDRSSLHLLEMFTSTTLGMTLLIDPTDGLAHPPATFKGVWDRRFDAIYRPSDAEDRSPVSSPIS